MQWSFLLLAVLFLTRFTEALSAAAIEEADTIFWNGNIYTVNASQPHSEAIAVKNGRILFVGSNADTRKLQGQRTQLIDLKQSTVVPGFTDSHAHLSGIGAREMTLNLEGITSLDQFLAKIKERVEQAKPGEWITGRGWIETFWQPPVFPTRLDLDRVSLDHPVFLSRADGHGAVANTAALKIARIGIETPSPFGGEIVKDRASGEPTGMLLDRAQDLVRRYLPPASKADQERAIVLGAQRSVELGWCELQDAGGSYEEVESIKKLYGSGQIKLRIYKAVHGPSESATRLLREGASIGTADGRFTLRTIKVMFDGALGSKGAALLEPYENDDKSGFLTQKPADLLPMFAEALRRGIQIETHAIGDRANRELLNLYERAFRGVPPSERAIRAPRWRVEHAQIVAPPDIPRFAQLGVIPSMQASHAISDLHFAPSRIGLGRLKGAYAWQSFLQSGSVIAGGSDAPVERGEPMIEFYAAVARRDQKGFRGEGWHPEQALSREQALKMLTLWPAYAAFEEKIKGSIEKEKLADLTVLSADIMNIPEAEILKTRCVMTVIGGEIVYNKL